MELDHFANKFVTATISTETSVDHYVMGINRHRSRLFIDNYVTVVYRNRTRVSVDNIMA